jgi:hypothetical protein
MVHNETYTNGRLIRESEINAPGAWIVALAKLGDTLIDTNPPHFAPS